MFNPSLPLHNVDAWELGFVLDDGLPVMSVEARGGMVVTGRAAEDVHMLRPGESPVISAKTGPSVPGGDTQRQAARPAS